MPRKTKDISKIECKTNSTYGWYVRVRFNGITYYKFFSYKKNGGKAEAYQMALMWRNAKEEEICKPRTDKNLVSVCRNNTGKVGVRRDDVNKRYEVYWVTLDGRPGRTSVSFKNRPKLSAFERACAIRDKNNEKRLGL